MDREFIFIGDPMCSWCWGFSPVMHALAERYADRLGLSVMVGGLRPGVAEPMDAKLKGYVRHHWDEVRKRTGQPFDFDFFRRENFIYDTEPACRAVVAMRELDPSQAFPFFTRTHEAFYARNVDVTDVAELAQLAEDGGVDRELFLASMGDLQTRMATSQEFTHVKELGIQGFPAVLLRDGDGADVLTVGYQPLDALIPAVDRWLEAGA